MLKVLDKKEYMEKFAFMALLENKSVEQLEDEYRKYLEECAGELSNLVFEETDYNRLRAIDKIIHGEDS
jgi:hypothetical protein